MRTQPLLDDVRPARNSGLHVELTSRHAIEMTDCNECTANLVKIHPRKLRIARSNDRYQVFELDADGISTCRDRSANTVITGIVRLLDPANDGVLVDHRRLRGCCYCRHCWTCPQLSP